MITLLMYTEGGCRETSEEVFHVWYDTSMMFDEQKEMFETYVSLLSYLPNAGVETAEDNQCICVAFKPRFDHALEVTLYFWKREPTFVAMDIKGVATGYWHTLEEEDLDYHMELAKAALKGEVKYHKSPFLRFNEVCFKSDDVWHCTRTNNDAAYHYIKIRETI